MPGRSDIHMTFISYELYDKMTETGAISIIKICCIVYSILSKVLVPHIVSQPY